MRERGFTLIELLVVIAIIGVLASVVLARLSDVRGAAEDARRKQDLYALQTALELYRNDFGRYPIANQWSGVSDNGGNLPTSGPGGYIPGLAPDYIGVLPTDPKGETVVWSGYLYVSDSIGSSYKLLSHSIGPNTYPSVGGQFYDPLRPGWSWMVCNGPACLY
jgi:general secretion pathway protein G